MLPKASLFTWAQGKIDIPHHKTVSTFAKRNLFFRSRYYSSPRILCLIWNIGDRSVDVCYHYTRFHIGAGGGSRYTGYTRWTTPVLEKNYYNPLRFNVHE